MKAILQGQILQGNSFQVTLSVDGWSDNQQAVYDDRLLADGYAYVISPDSSNYTSYSAIYAEDVIVDGIVTFVCTEVPEADLTVNILRLEAKES